MVVYDILSPEYDSYPFEQVFYENALVVYHGTSSCYSPVIDIHGFQSRFFHFELQGIEQLMAAYNAIGFEPKSGGYWDLQYYSRWAQIDKRTDWCVHLSQNFWFAKCYAVNIGGETARLVLQAVHQFLAFVINDAKRQKHLKRLEHQLKRQNIKQSSLALLEQQMYNLQVPHVLNRLQDQVRQLQNKWQNLTEGAFPVVYAIIVAQEWFPQCPESCLRPSIVGSFRMSEATDLECQQSISPEHIVAKAQYVNGTHRGYHMPSPARWEVARKWLPGSTGEILGGNTVADP
jgi:hypothetical protein